MLVSEKAGTLLLVTLTGALGDTWYVGGPKSLTLVLDVATLCILELRLTAKGPS